MRSRATRLVLLTALVFVLVASAALPAWSPSVTMSGNYVSFVDAAVDADGDAVFGWFRSSLEGDRFIEARRRSADGTLGRVVPLSRSGAFGRPRVAVSPSGDAVVAWTERGSAHDRIVARALPAGGGMGPVFDVSGPRGTPDGLSLVIETSADGTTAFAWTQSFREDRIQLRVREPDGELGRVRTLSSSQVAATEPRLAMAGDGDAVVAWRARSAGASWIEARAWTAAGGLRPVQRISRAGRTATAADVGLDAHGNAVFAWSEPHAVLTRDRSAGGTLSPTQNLGRTPGLSTTFLVALDVADSGAAAFTWVAVRNTSAGPISSARSVMRSASGQSTDERRIANGAAGIWPMVEIDDDGNAVYAWERNDGGSGELRARQRFADGSFGPFASLTAGPAVLQSKLAVGTGGDSALVWTTNDDDTAQASFGP